ncbi:hypothetical protein M8J75_011925 [Diaphorina citri]|nr:hypothetical protein M8J75_011925 [Diaphorina citri]
MSSQSKVTFYELFKFDPRGLRTQEDVSRSVVWMESGFSFTSLSQQHEIHPANQLALKAQTAESQVLTEDILEGKCVRTEAIG